MTCNVASLVGTWGWSQTPWAVIDLATYCVTLANYLMMCFRLSSTKKKSDLLHWVVKIMLIRTVLGT